MLSTDKNKNYWALVAGILPFLDQSIKFPLSMKRNWSCMCVFDVGFIYLFIFISMYYYYCVSMWYSFTSVSRPKIGLVVWYMIWYLKHTYIHTYICTILYSFISYFTGDVVLYGRLFYTVLEYSVLEAAVRKCRQGLSLSMLNRFFMYSSIYTRISSYNL